MFGKHKTEVLVVGAGPVGLYAALELADRGLKVEVIDSQWRTAAHSYALALHPASLEMLDRLGLADDLLEHGHRVDTVAFYDGGERRGELRLASLSTKFPFVLVLPQQALEDTFENRLHDLKVKVSWNHRLTKLEAGDDGATAHVDKLIKEASGYAYSATDWVVDKKLETRAEFVIGADGLRSTVRRDLDIDFPELGERQFFGVFELNAAMTGSNEVRVVLDDDTTNVLWPMHGDHFRWSFELDADLELAPRSRTKSRLTVQVGDETYLFLDEAKLHELVAARAPWFDAEIGDVTWSVAVRFEKRLASSFGTGRAWLVGDAGHVAGPVGVQSMNVGFREARDLAGWIHAVLRQRAPISSFDAYSPERQHEWRTLLGLENGMKAGAGASEWVRRHSDRILPCVPASGDHLRQLLAQIGLELSS